MSGLSRQVTARWRFYTKCYLGDWSSDLPMAAHNRSTAVHHLTQYWIFKFPFALMPKSHNKQGICRGSRRRLASLGQILVETSAS